MPALTDSKTEKVAEIIKRIHRGEIKDLLVVGCGEGLEAAILAQRLNTKVVGIDVDDDFDEDAARLARLQTGDAMSLEFPDETFDFVFSYHALEHIQDPRKALMEIYRVLKKGGGFWIGTPNRSRVAGYIGGKNTSLGEKIKWNLADWKARLTGRFKNELGAHAGFSATELYALLGGVFPEVEDQTKIYFREVYAHHPRLIKLIESSVISQFIYPSVYFSGRK